MTNVYGHNSQLDTCQKAYRPQCINAMLALGKVVDNQIDFKSLKEKKCTSNVNLLSRQFWVPDGIRTDLLIRTDWAFTQRNNLLSNYQIYCFYW